MSRPKASPSEVHRIIRTAAKMVGYTKPDPTTLQKLGESSDDPFKVLIGTVLSQRTRDPVTDLASSRLFAKYPDVKRLAKADTRTVARLIRPVGFYKTKARQLKKISRVLLDRHGGEVPATMEKLLDLPQVGRKTANCVLVYGFGKPAIPVDTHVHRIFNRLGLVKTKTPEQTEAELVKIADKRDWLELNEVIVKFGQTICKPIGPKCPDCSLNSVCSYYLEKKG